MWQVLAPMETIYERPEDYDLEHEGDEEDITFYTKLLERWRPRRIMELAAGTGRVTIPLARAAASAGIEIVGLERDGPMLQEARRKVAELDERERACVTLMTGDMRAWETAERFDLVIAPCSSLSHLLTLDDQLAAWKCAHENLRDGGRFVADLTMPNLTVYADRCRRRRGRSSKWTSTRVIRRAERGCFGTRRRGTCRTSSAPRCDFYTTGLRKAVM
jgi:predicted O-methyltransferase YrrM